MYLTGRLHSNSEQIALKNHLFPNNGNWLLDVRFTKWCWCPLLPNWLIKIETFSPHFPLNRLYCPVAFDWDLCPHACSLHVYLLCGCVIFVSLQKRGAWFGRGSADGSQDYDDHCCCCIYVLVHERRIQIHEGEQTEKWRTCQWRTIRWQNEEKRGDIK